MTTETKAAALSVLLFDVDGVLTDGKILLDADGRESKRFDIKDGTALVWAQRLGLTVGFLSARSSAATSRRAEQLGITLVHQGVPSKLQAYEQIVDALLLEDDRVAYMGDDILDLPVLERVGLSAAPADAAPDVLTRVDWVSRVGGGDGAAREFIEFVLRAQGRWDSILETYLAEGRQP